MNAPKPPAPPDPQATAAAQTASNLKTATTTQQLNMVDQSNPYGSQNYTQSGTWADGTPKFQVSTTLSPQEQAKQDQQWQFDNLTNQLGIDQTKKLSGLLDKPVDLNNEATESRLMQLGQARLDPIMQLRRQQLETKLTNQGSGPGTPGYDNAMKQFGQQENDAYNQLLLTGRGQATQEAIQQRNQPINEITALMSGGQVTPFNPVGTPSTNVAGTDVAGLTMDAYKYGPLAQYQAEAANKQAMMSGLFNLGSAALGGWAKGGFPTPSDRRLKTDIIKLSDDPRGFGVYAYRYRTDEPDRLRVGYMADEVEAVAPWAVTRTPDGFAAIYYDLLNRAA